MTAKLLHFSDVENVYDDPESIARFCRAIETERDPRTLVVSSGDNVAPSVLGLTEEGDHALALFDVLDPDVSTFGNHDFDFGPEATRRIVAESPQEWVSANLYEPPEDGRADDPASLDRFAGVEPVAVRDVGDLRIGFVGVIDPSSSIPPELVATDPVAAVERHVADLRPDVDRVVVLAHLDRDQTASVASLDAIDFVCGGHVHDICHRRVGDTHVVRPGVNADSVWEIPLDATGESPTRHVVADGRADPEVADRFRRRHAEMGLSDTVWTVDRQIERTRSVCLQNACQAGTLVAEAYRWSVDGDVGFVDTGAIRDGPPLVGEITQLDLVGLVPFPGELCAVEVTGRRLQSFVEDLRRPANDLGFDATGPVWWGQLSGVGVTTDDEGAIRELTVDGEPVADESSYLMGTNCYVVGADDEFPAVTWDHVVEICGVQYEAVVEYVEATGFDFEAETECR